MHRIHVAVASRRSGDDLTSYASPKCAVDVLQHSSMTNVAFESFQRCAILVQNQHTATDEEWNQWLAFVAQSRARWASDLRILILSAGGTPTPKQRSMVHALMPKSGNGVLTAVVTSSFFGRTVVSAMSLFNRNVQAFSIRLARDAFNYLGIPSTRHMELMTRLRLMHERLDIPFRVELG